MSKSLPVYELGQWVKSDRNIGYVVARMSAANVWDVRDDYANRKDVERFVGRGAGYVIQWVDLVVQVGNGRTLTYDHRDISDGDGITSTEPRRLSWLRAETIAEKRYQPCENPVKAPIVPNGSALPSSEMTRAQFAEFEAVMAGPPSQPTLPLDIEAATEATMRAAVALGNQASDWLRAKGLTP